MFKSKKYDTTKLETQFRVMLAELTVKIRKQQQIVDNVQRLLVSEIKRDNKEAIYEKAYKLAEEKSMLNGLNLVKEAIENIKLNKEHAVPSKKGPDPVIEGSFRILFCSIPILNIASFKKFQEHAQKEMYDKSTIANLMDRSLVDDRLVTYLLPSSYSENDIVSILKTVGEQNNCTQKIEQITGFSLSQKQEIQNIPDPWAGLNNPGFVSYPTISDSAPAPHLTYPDEETHQTVNYPAPTNYPQQQPTFQYPDIKPIGPLQSPPNCGASHHENVIRPTDRLMELIPEKWNVLLSEINDAIA